MALASPLPLHWPNHSPTYSSSTTFHCSSSSLPNISSSEPRPAVILPGLGNNTGDYQGLQTTLQQYKVKTVVAKVSRIDWLRNAAGLIDPNYWKGTLRPRPVLDWYLNRINEAITDAKALSNGNKISLVGHSAGGWLARVYMEEFGMSDIALLLSLGTPHNPPPKGVSGVIDQTRGLLDYVENNCAKAVYLPELKYVCVAGRYIQGVRVFGNSSKEVEYVDEISEGAATINAPGPTSGSGRLQARFVGQGYKQVCGRADVWGDGVVPEVSAYLEGALNISLDGVYHSPVGSDEESRPWYGEPKIVKNWINHLLD